MLCVADGSVSAFTIFRGGNLKTFYIAEILTPAIAPTLDMICTAKLGCNLYISADWLGPGALQMLVELEKSRLPEKAFDQKYFLLFLIVFSLKANLYL